VARAWVRAEVKKHPVWHLLAASREEGRGFAPTMPRIKYLDRKQNKKISIYRKSRTMSNKS
jgi:hypothetical protein